jgi:tRNA-specific 2-thiouridylase
MNQVVVSTRDQAGKNECIVGRMNWVSIDEPNIPIKAEVKVRYRTTAVGVNIIPISNNRIRLVFDEPQFGITPGQAAVLYQGDLLLGGGIIQRD